MDPSTHAQTPVPFDAADDLTAPQDPLDAILRQIVDGYFVLTDGQGAVSKWSEPAELLFGREAGEVLGQSFFSTLVGEPIPAAADAWRRFLESGEAPGVPGRIDVSGMHSDATAFPMEAVFVPVKLDEGFDFSLFLEDLGFELPMNLMLLRMRQQHPVVVRALRQALEAEPQPWEGWRTAGTLVIFRPLAPTPWVESELAAREAARAEADAATEERFTNIDPGIQGDVNDLDDAAAVVARLLSAMERIDELERVARGLPGQLEEARQSAERRADAAERDARALREDMQRALSANDQRELLVRLDRLEYARLDAEQATADRAKSLDAAEAARAKLTARLDRLEQEQADAASAADTRLVEAIAQAQRRADEALAAAADRPDADADAAAVRAELAATIERLEADRAREAEATRSELAAALQRIEEVHREATDAGLSDEDRRRLDDLGRGAESAQAHIDSLREQIDRSVGRLGERVDALAATEDLGALRNQVEGELAGLRDRIGNADDDQQEQVRTWLEDARRERDELRSAAERASAQVDELRRSLDERDRASASAAQAVEQDVVDAMGGELEALRGAEQALRMRLADLEAAGAAAARRIDEVQAAADEARNRDDDAHRRIDELAAAAGRDDEARARIDELAAAATRDDEAHRRIDELAAAAVRDDEAHERIDAVAATAEAAASRVESVRDDAAGLVREATEIAEATARRLDELGGDVDHRFTALVDEQAEMRTRAGQIGGLAERLDAVDRGAGGVLADVRALRERADEIAAAAEQARTAGEAVAGKIDSLDGRVRGLGTDMAAGRERLDSLDARLVRFGQDVAQSGQETRAALEGQATELRQELAAVRRIAENASSASEAGARRVEALQAELSSALVSLEEVKAGLTSAGQDAVLARREAEQAKKVAGEGHSGVNEVFQQLLAAARNSGQGATTSAQAPRRAPRRTLASLRPESVKREPRDGFDDRAQPCAVLSLDGIFRELNPSFARLVGYQEHEFAKAAWPSPHDRASYQQQQEQLRQLVSGEIESVSVQSTYMHGQGLMVPVMGTIRAVQGQDGRPLHLLLEAEERAHA